MADDTNPFAKYVTDTEENPFAKYAPEGALVSVPPQPLPGVLSREQAEDIVKSAGTGIAHGAAGIAGMQGDVEGLLDQAVRWAGNKAGLPEPPATRPSMASRIAPPTSSDVLSTIETATGGLHKPASTAGRFAESVGEFTPAAVLAGPQAGLGASLFKYAAAPGLASEAAGQLTQGTPAEPWARLAAAVGSPGIARKLVTPFNVTPGDQATRATLLGEGITPSAGKVTRNKNLQYLESALNPDTNVQRAENFTRASMRRVGMNSLATQGPGGAIDRMLTDSSNTYNRITSRNTLVADPQLAADLTNTQNEYASPLYPSDTVNAVNEAIKRTNGILAANGGVMKGTDYQTLRTQLNRAAMGYSDPQRAGAVRDVVEHLDDAMERSIAANNPNDAGVFPAARRQYRNALVIEKAVGSRNDEDTARGLISPAQLANASKSVYGKRAYLRGYDDFSELAQAGVSQLIPPSTSGSSERIRVNEAIRGLAGLGGAAIGAHTGGASGATEGAVLGLLSGEAAAPALEIPLRAGLRRAIEFGPIQSYLQNSVLPRIPVAQDPAKIAMTAQALMKGARGAGYLPVPNTDQRAAQ